MPIKGLSEERRLPRAGKIRLGIKKESAKGNLYPSATDYFVVNPDKSTSAAAAAAFKAAYGDAPKSLDILLPNVADDLEALKEVLFPQYYKQYGSGTGLKCKGDGEKAERVELDQATGLMGRKQIVCPGPELCPLVKKMSDGSGGMKFDCGPVAHLQVLLPRVDFLGIWQIDTGSENSIRGINSDLDMIWRAAGTVANLPLKMELEPREVAPGGKKKTIYVVKLTCPVSLRELKSLRGNKQAFLVDLVDDTEVPTDLRPLEALQPHPLINHVPGAAAQPPAAAAAPASTPPPAAPGALPHFEAGFGPDAPTGSAPAGADSKSGYVHGENLIEDGIRFHAWRVGMTDLQRETTRRLHGSPEKFLSALQKQKVTATRARDLHFLGYDESGFSMTTGEAGGPHIVPPQGGR